MASSLFIYTTEIQNAVGLEPSQTQFFTSLVYEYTIKINDHEVAGSIPGSSTNVKSGLGLERGPPSLVRTIG